MISTKNHTLMELFLLFTTTAGFIFIYFIYRLWKNKGNYWEKRGVPCITNPPFGIMTDLILLRGDVGKIFCKIYKKFQNEKFVGYFQFYTPVIMVRDPELINNILVKDFTHFEDRLPPKKGSKDIFTKIISQLSGDEWREVRHILTPSFTSGKLKTIFGTIKVCNDEALDYIDSKTGQTIEVKEFLMRWTLNILGNMACGIKLHTLNEEDTQSCEFFKQTAKFFKSGFLKSIKYITAMAFPFLQNILKLNILEDEIVQFFRNFSKSVIEYREKTGTRKNDYIQILIDQKKKEDLIESDNCGQIDEDETIDPDDKKLMDQLTFNSTRRNRKIFTDDFITSNSLMFLSAGTEALASGLAFVLFELALHQDMQKRVALEIIETFSSQNLDYSSMMKLNYMDQIIHETFRVHPPTPMLFRVCTKTYKIPGTDVVIEKGTHVNIPSVALCKDPQYFPDPEEFNPDRFQDMQNIPRGVFFPFGDGPRICIAKKLAMLQMKVMLAAILLKYDIVLSEKTTLPLKTKLTLFMNTMDDGIWLKLKKKEK